MLLGAGRVRTVRPEALARAVAVVVAEALGAAEALAFGAADALAFGAAEEIGRAHV